MRFLLCLLGFAGAAGCGARVQDESGTDAGVGDAASPRDSGVGGADGAASCRCALDPRPPSLTVPICVTREEQEAARCSRFAI